jgi:hypothetical protein
MHSLNQKDLGRAVAAQRLQAAISRRKAGTSRNGPPGRHAGKAGAARGEHRPNSAVAARRATA